MSDKPPIPEDLLNILRCPEALRQGKEGKLRLVKDTWLVSDDTGYKYPIRNGIPVMLPEAGAKYKDHAEADLPVPPPDED